MRLTDQEFRDYKRRLSHLNQDKEIDKLINKKKHKYFAVETKVGEIKFQSKAEANLFKILMRMKKVGGLVCSSNTV